MKDVKENNKLIATPEERELIERFINDGIPFSNIVTWNTLMPVVEKIFSLGFFVTCNDMINSDVKIYQIRIMHEREKDGCIVDLVSDFFYENETKIST